MTARDDAIGADLERRRLLRRERRLELVVRELRLRAEARRTADSAVPAPLGRALHDMAEELRLVRRSLGSSRHR